MSRPLDASMSVLMIETNHPRLLTFGWTLNFEFDRAGTGVSERQNLFNWDALSKGLSSSVLVIGWRQLKGCDILVI